MTRLGTAEDDEVCFQSNVAGLGALGLLACAGSGKLHRSLLNYYATADSRRYWRVHVRHRCLTAYLSPNAPAAPKTAPAPPVGRRPPTRPSRPGGLTPSTGLMAGRRDPEVSVHVALRDVQCPRCNGHGMPRIIALAQRPSI